MRQLSVTYPQSDVTMDLWGGTAGTYTGLDRFGRLTDLPWIHDLSGSPTDLARIKYGYNRASSPTYARDEVARAANADLDQLYGYDGLQRLIDFQQGELSGTNTSISSSTLAQDWNLDQVGNWDGFNQEVTGILNQTRTHNRVNEITGISNSSGQPVWVDPAYDDAGNMTLTPRPNDPSNGFVLTFDAWNRMTKIETTDASPKLVAQYAYDGRNHRTSKRIYDSSGLLASTIEYFYNSAWQCVEEQETPVSSSTSTSTYVWGIRYIDDLVCRDTATDRLYAMQDRQYKMVGIINPSGNVEERYSYTPYGGTFFYAADFTPRTSSNYAWVYLYTSRRLDPETGLYYFRNRYYDPGLGRFCSRDPIGRWGGDMNFYNFVRNSPLVKLDNLGLMATVPVTSPNVSGTCTSGVSISSTPYFAGSIEWTNRSIVTAAGVPVFGATGVCFSISCRCVPCSREVSTDCCGGAHAYAIDCQIQIRFHIFLNLRHINAMGMNVDNVYGHEERHILGYLRAMRQIANTHSSPNPSVPSLLANNSCLDLAECSTKTNSFESFFEDRVWPRQRDLSGLHQSPYPPPFPDDPLGSAGGSPTFSSDSLPCAERDLEEQLARN